MPIAVKKLLQSLELEVTHQLKWGERFPRRIKGDPKHKYEYKGIYIISLSGNREKNENLLQDPEFNLEKVNKWQLIAKNMRVDGEIATEASLIKRLKEFWLPDENILYIGKADKSVKGRLYNFYKQVPGYNKKHAGGFWLLLLKILDDLNIYTMEVTEVLLEKIKLKNDILDDVTVETVEILLLKKFMEQVSDATLLKIKDKSLPLPFANMKLKSGIIKEHGIAFQCVEKPKAL